MRKLGAQGYGFGLVALIVESALKKRAKVRDYKIDVKILSTRCKSSWKKLCGRWRWNAVL